MFPKFFQSFSFNIDKTFLKNIDSSHLFTFLNQFLRTLIVILTIILVPLFLTEEEQGYWFSFTSLSALMVLANSGFSIIILQFAAHEFAFLSFNASGKIEGDELHLKRLGSFYIFCIKWLTALACIASPVIAGIGIFIMSRRSAGADWILPWLLYMLVSITVFISNGLLFFFEGCDSVSEAQKIRSKMNLVMIAALCISLISGLKLYSLSAAVLLSSLIPIIFIYRRFGSAASCLLTNAKGFSRNWSKEFFPLFGRYSLSWASGYFLFQMYTPIMLYCSGPVEAGKIGISITLWSGVFSISNIWLYVITPKINIHISQKNWKYLDTLFFRNLSLSAITYIVGMMLVFSVLAIFFQHQTISGRFLGPTSMFLLACGWGFQLIINGLAIYLRAHKEEPLVLPSVVSAIYVTITTYLSAKYLPIDYFFLGFFSSYLWGLPWILTIFKSKRIKGHFSEQI